MDEVEEEGKESSEILRDGEREGGEEGEVGDVATRRTWLRRRAILIMLVFS